MVTGMLVDAALSQLPASLSQYFGPIAALLTFTIIVAATYLFFRFFMIILKASRTSPEMQKHIINQVRWPYYFIAISVAAFLGIRRIAQYALYSNEIKAAFFILWILLGVYISKRAVAAIIVWMASERRPIRIEKTALMSLKSLISIFIYAIALILILHLFGVEITPLMASLGIGGLAIALALQPTLSSYFAGMYIAADKTAYLGDWIELENGLAGTVDKMGWRTTWIVTFEGNRVSIPNSKLADSIITNFSRPKKELTFGIPIGVAYGSDLEKVEKITLDVAKRVLEKSEGYIEDFEPFLRYKAFADSNINFDVLLKVRDRPHKFTTRHEFIKALDKAYKKAGIEISFPCVNIYSKRSHPVAK